MTRIPEPWEYADAHYAKLEEERKAMLDEAICGECAIYTAVPDKYVKIPCGFCDVCGEYVEYGDSVAYYECEDFKPRL